MDYFYKIPRTVATPEKCDMHIFLLKNEHAICSRCKKENECIALHSSLPPEDPSVEFLCFICCAYFYYQKRNEWRSLSF